MSKSYRLKNLKNYRAGRVFIHFTDEDTEAQDHTVSLRVKSPPWVSNKILQALYFQSLMGLLTDKEFEL